MEGRHHISFCGVLLDPTIVSACLYTTADCYRAFREATRLCVSLLRAGHQAVAARFATKGGGKFAFGDFAVDLHGMPYLASTPWSCHADFISTCTVGDHEVLFGTVTEIQDNSGTHTVSPDPLCTGKGSSCASRPSSAL